MRTCHLASLAVALVAGCGYPWRVVRQASPNPFVNQRHFGIEPMTYEGLQVGPGSEAEHLADKSPDQVASWEQDKAALDGAFRAGLTADLAGHALAAPGSVPWTLRPHVTFIEPGFYVGVAHAPTRVDLTLFILDAQTGGVLDEIQFDCTEEASLTNPAVGGRLRACGERLGELVAYYVNERTGVD